MLACPAHVQRWATSSLLETERNGLFLSFSLFSQCTEKEKIQGVFLEYIEGLNGCILEWVELVGATYENYFAFFIQFILSNDHALLYVFLQKYKTKNQAFENYKTNSSVSKEGWKLKATR